MSLTAAQIRKLDRMNRAAQDSSLGTLLGTIEGQGVVADELNSKVGTSGNHVHVISAAEATAGEAVIFDRTESGLAISTWIVQVYRSDVLMKDYVVDCAGFTLTLKDNGGSFDITEGDVVTAMVF